MVNLDLKLLVTEILCAGDGSYGYCWNNSRETELTFH